VYHAATFKVDPLQLDAVNQGIVPLLEAFAEGLCFEFGLQFLDHDVKSLPLQYQLVIQQKKNVT
jgi:hypothetical protein